MVAWPVGVLAAGGIDTGIELAVTAFAWLNGHVAALIANAYERSPVLVAVLAALLVVPLVALVALLSHALQLNWRGRNAPKLPTTRRPTFHPTISAVMPGETPWPATAWLAIDGFPQAPLPKVQGLVRIGRHEDNDIRLPHSSVHRHHALIHRTPEAEFIIMDLSGQDGNGVVVNGERRTEARLKPGDQIELGTVCLRFESAPL
jgi:FHA domain